jgi:2-octaprenyl-6-methoxyphenol hydroxylase
MAKGPAAVLAELQSAFGFRLGRFRELLALQAYPLDLVVADRVTAPRTVIMGNAAHGLHPVAGQGYNLGLRDVAALAELLADQLRDAVTTDPGAPELLARYATWRQQDQRQVVAFTDGLVRAFGLAVPGAASLRGLALQLFETLPGAKTVLARETMGLGGTMSRLARGLPL